MSRAPLTLDQLIPRPDIKERIEEYKNEKMAMKMSMKWVVIQFKGKEHLDTKNKICLSFKCMN